MLLRLTDGTCDTETGVVRRGDRIDALTDKERELAHYLAQRAGRVVTTEELLREVWGYAASAETRAVFHTCRRLRAKIEDDPSDARIIVAERAVGYRLDPAALAPATAPAVAPTFRALPAERNRFFGREAELTQLGQRYTRGDRLVTLVGLGGIGKTRLALRFARTAWQGPVAFCDLVDAREEADALGAALFAIGVAPSGGDLERGLGERLRAAGRALLIVDNAESALTVTARLVGRCLDAAPELCVLVTSRAPLGIPGESRIPLYGLASEAAMELLLARAESDARDGGAFAEVVTLLDGIPLALELAAARTSFVGPDALRALLQERGGPSRQSDAAWLRLLADPGSDDRHGAMRTVLDGTWSLLGADARRALGRLAVFEGGVTVGAAEVVLAGEVDGWVPDILDRLARAALLRRTGDTRLAMLPTIQAFARGQLVPEELTRAYERQEAWLLERYTAPLSAERQLEREEDKANLLVACERSIAAASPLVARLLWTAWGVLSSVGPVTRAVSLADAALAVPGLALSDRRVALRVAMFARRRVGDLRGCIEAAAGLQALGEHLDDAETIAQARSVAGYTHYLLGETDAAREHLEAARLLADRCSPVMRGAVCSRLATLRRAEGRLDESIALYEETVRLNVSGTVDHGVAWLRVGDLRLLLGDVAGAHVALAQARAGTARSAVLAEGILHLALVLAEEEGDGEAVRRLGGELLRSGSATSDPVSACRALLALAVDAALGGRHGEALQHARSAVALPVDAIRDRALALACLGWVEACAGVAGSEARLQAAVDALGEAPSPLERRQLLALAAGAALERGDEVAARALLAEAEGHRSPVLFLERRFRARLG